LTVASLAALTLLLSLVLAAQIAAPCKGSDLSGTFAAVPGSAGAGNIVYALRVKNTSAAACTVTGIPRLTLLDRGGRRLPTHPFPAHPGALTAVLVTLAPGKTATATARFSPDVPGTGEPVDGRRCEPVAYNLLVRPNGGGTLRAPIRPPTPVCEHGGMSWSVLTKSR
jgi:Domain of unknown function (DUF4232)